jgi:hypothetical protein
MGFEISPTFGSFCEEVYAGETILKKVKRAIKEDGKNMQMARGLPA